MAINTLAFRDNFTSELDKKLVQTSQAAILGSGMKHLFVGAHTVKMPSVSFVGLGDYDRDTGFAKGSVTVSQQTFTLTKDRGRTFSIDREDMDETGIAGLAGQVMGEFVRTEVAPEIDAYTFSTIAAKATAASQTVALGTGETIAKNALALVRRAISKADEATGFNGEELVVFVNPEVYDALMSTSEINRYIRMDEFKKGELSTKVAKIDNAIILPVADARMKSAYTFNAGSTTSAGGFAATSSANSIGLICMPKKAAELVKKTEKIRVFDPDTNQSMDAYKFDYRLFYDVLIKDSLKGAIYTYTYSAS